MYLTCYTKNEKERERESKQGEENDTRCAVTWETRGYVCVPVCMYVPECVCTVICLLFFRIIYAGEMIVSLTAGCKGDLGVLEISIHSLYDAIHLSPILGV